MRVLLLLLVVVAGGCRISIECNPDQTVKDYSCWGLLCEPTGSTVNEVCKKRDANTDGNH